MLLIDYFLVSFVGAEVNEVVDYLFEDKLDELEVRDSAVKGFKSTLTNGWVFFHYDNRGDKPVVLLQIAGQGCRWLEENTNHDWIDFFKKIINSYHCILLESVNYKRLDIAYDAYDDKGLTPSRVLKWHKLGLITSRLQTIRHISEQSIKSGKLLGNSCYIGKRKSNLHLIIYDKKLESKVDDVDFWFRCELRTRGNRTKQAIDSLLECPAEFGVYVASTLREVLQIRSSTHKRTEVKRRNLAPWYVEYLEYVSKQKLVKAC